MRIYRNSEIMYCCNCGKKGHNYKKCLSPVISYGIILYDKRNGLDNIKYLMIQRKDTIGFVEFIRGKYNLNNYKYISQIFKIMTKKERDCIIKLEFDDLWNLLWLNKHKNNKNTLLEYKTSREKFNILKRGVFINNKFIDLNIINTNTHIIYEEPEWGFPKGRRNMYESDIRCALREFTEETNIQSCDYVINDYNKTFIETFYGTNNIKYRHIYYIGELINDIDLKIDKNNINQTSEISSLDWFNSRDGYNIIRPYNLEKKRVVNYINSYLLQK